MSRHRLVRNIDIHGPSFLSLNPTSFSSSYPSAELDDAAFDDDTDELTEEQHGASSPPPPPPFPNPSSYLAQMESGIEHIRAIVGDESTSGLDDAIITDTLWQFYFDIDQSIAWLLGSSSPLHTTPTPSPFSDEQERRAAARERKGKPSYLLSLLA